MRTIMYKKDTGNWCNRTNNIHTFLSFPQCALKKQTNWLNKNTLAPHCYEQSCLWELIGWLVCPIHLETMCVDRYSCSLLGSLPLILQIKLQLIKTWNFICILLNFSHHCVFHTKSPWWGRLIKLLLESQTAEPFE